MSEQNNFVVAGYRFGSLQDARKAEEEQKRAIYFEERLSGRSIENMLSIYDRVLDEKMFVTPVGWEYLKYLQGRLREGGIEEDRIRPVPLYMTFAFDSPDEKANRGVAREYVRPSVKQKRSQEARRRISIIANVILAFAVIAMFVITMNGENVNAINYRSAIINEYASWEKELSEREAAVREKEQELGMTSEEETDTEKFTE